MAGEFLVLLTWQGERMAGLLPLWMLLQLKLDLNLTNLKCQFIEKTFLSFLEGKYEAVLFILLVILKNGNHWIKKRQVLLSNAEASQIRLHIYIYPQH